MTVEEEEWPASSSRLAYGGGKKREGSVQAGAPAKRRPVAVVSLVTPEQELRRQTRAREEGRLAWDAETQTWSGDLSFVKIVASQILPLTDGSEDDRYQADWREVAAGVAEQLETHLGGTTVRHHLLERDVEDLPSGYQAHFWTAFAAGDSGLQLQHNGMGTMFLLIPGPSGGLVLKYLKVLNATEAARLPAREPVLLCAPSSFDLHQGASSPVVVFPVSRFLHDAQVHDNASEVIEGLAERMTMSLTCLLHDFRSAVRTIPQESAEGVDPLQVPADIAFPCWDGEGHWTGFTVAKFLAVIYAVAGAYTHWVPLGRDSVCQPASRRRGHQIEDSLDYVTVDGPHPAVTREFFEVLSHIPRPMGAAIDPLTVFVHSCLSLGHCGPNGYLTSQLFTQRKWNDKPRQVCFQCY